MSAQGLGGGGMSKRTAVTVVSGALLTVSFAAAQPPPTSQAPEPTPRFTSGAEVVAVDLVVRDKKGRLVTDLRQDEIEILEDGVPQKIASYREQLRGMAQNTARYTQTERDKIVLSRYL